MRKIDEILFGGEGGEGGEEEDKSSCADFLGSSIDAVSDFCTLIIESGEDATKRRLYENCLHRQEEEVARQLAEMKSMDLETIDGLFFEIGIESTMLKVVLGENVPDGIIIYESVERILGLARLFLERKGKNDGK